MKWSKTAKKVNSKISLVRKSKNSYYFARAGCKHEHAQLISINLKSNLKKNVPAKSRPLSILESSKLCSPHLHK